MTDNRFTTKLLCVGLSHHSASIEQRELLANLSDDLDTSELLGGIPILESALVSTCNRLEWYVVTHDGECADTQSLSDRLEQELYHKANRTLCRTDDAFFVYEGAESAAHLFSVASGLDSMVIGESQILGQVSGAYTEAIEKRTIGPVLDALFRAAIRCGKRVRSETALGCSPASVSSVALDLARQQLGSLENENVLLIGLGQMGTLAHKLMRAIGAKNVVLMNRTYERAQGMAGSDWSARPWDELPQALAGASCVISATKAPHAVITVDMIMRAVELRKNGSYGDFTAKPWVFIDLALPRDVEIEAAKVPGLKLYDLDDLQSVVDGAIATREATVPAAQAIVTQEVTAFEEKMRELEVRSLVVELRQRAEAIREEELARSLRFIGDVEPETVDHLDHLTRALVNKLLHAPTVHMKELARADRSDEVLTTVSELFGLNGASSSR